MKINYTILTLLSLFSYVVINAQPKIRQQKVIGGNDYDQASCMVHTNDNGYLLGGSSLSNASFDKTENSKGGYDYWIVKLDSLRNILWDKTIGGTANDKLYSVQQTTDGGYILCGTSESGISGDKTDTTRGWVDLWIVKTNSAGNIEWDKTIGGAKYSAIQEPVKIQQTQDGGYIVGCMAISGIGGEKTEPSWGRDDIWVVKLNATGNKEWDKTLGTLSWDNFADIKQTQDLGFIVGGSPQPYFTNPISGNRTAPSKGNEDYWIIKLSPAGIIEWDKAFGGSRGDGLKVIEVTDDKGLILGGYSHSSTTGDKTKGRKGGVDFWIVKLDSTYNLEWENTIGGGEYGGNDYLTAITQTTQGGFLLGGYSKANASFNKTEDNRGPYQRPNETHDYWVVKINKTGKVLWDKTIGGSNDDRLTGMVEINNNRFALLGYSNSQKTADKNQKLYANTANDFWYVELQYVDSSSKLTTQTATNNILTPKNNQSKFVAYPNPAKNMLYVNSSSAAVVTLIDMQGKLLLTKTINGNATIDVSKYTPGTYFLKNNTTGQVEKIIITGK